MKCTDRHIDWSKEDLFPTERYGVSTLLPGRRQHKVRAISEAEVIHWLIQSDLPDNPFRNRKQREAIARKVIESTK